MLGGVTIPSNKGLLGHSDGDALLHSVIDALLGAAGLGDIGAHFPSTNPEFRDASSRDLLSRIATLIYKNGWRLVNLDATIIVEHPVMKPYLDPMRQGIASCLVVDSNRINIKAKTNDGLGIIGAGEGIVAQTIALLEEIA
ncbi:MAG: 2-C-methyl-D-erythritol 2,4-cyclodiphosphate synthase [Chloroflexota bacterium]|nr:2-C-methyl-D-erythritol 2,4-cyclodiphosphate synthase [Chloroflexota bacterium]